MMELPVVFFKSFSLFSGGRAIKAGASCAHGDIHIFFMMDRPGFVHIASELFCEFQINGMLDMDGSWPGGVWIE